MAREKWQANMEKVAFMKEFPGLAFTWEQVAGKTIESVTPLPSRPGYATLVFTDGSFVVAPALNTQPGELGEGLQSAREELKSKHPGPYKEYERLAKRDKDATRNAKADKIIGAIRNNLEQIPDLKDRIRRLVKEWK